MNRLRQPVRQPSDEEESIVESSIIEPGAMETDGHTFYQEEDDDDDETSESSDDEEEDSEQDDKNNIKDSNPIKADSSDLKQPTTTSPDDPKIQQKSVKAVLSDKEEHRAKEVFGVCDTFDEGHLNKDQFAHALAMLGYQFDEKRVKELYQQASTDSLKLGAFIEILSKLRTQDDDELNQKVKEAFEDLFAGTCKDPDRQKNSAGDKFILVKDLRLVLTTKGDKLTDEEADELIRECCPQPGDDGDKTDEGDKRIFFDQYRAMLLDSGM